MSRKNRPKIYIDGADSIGWSVDSDRSLLNSQVNDLGLEIVDNWKKADIVHNIWWNNAINTLSDYFKTKWLFRGKPKLLVTCSNFVDPELPEFSLTQQLNFVKKHATAWIAPSAKQMKILINLGLKAFYHPFSISLNLFKPFEKPNKEKIGRQFGIDYNRFKDKIVISSFQRDSLGSDLSKPKWQKNPQLLIDLLKTLPSNKYVLLLAGPRRHFVIQQCKKHSIPYLYVGKETPSDDLIENALPLEKMPSLYALTDVYLITSKSEGGPKAALEATATKTFVMSTDVGLAPDFIDHQFIYKNIELFKERLQYVISNFHADQFVKDQIVDRNYNNCRQLIDPEKAKMRLSRIYQGVLSV